MTRVTKPSTKMVPPTPATPLECSAQPKAGRALFASYTDFATQFRKDQRGSTMMMFALLITPVMFLTGMAVDYSRMITVRNRMQTAIDAAALAGVRAQQLSGVANTYQTTATNFYNGSTSGKLPFAVSPSTMKTPSLNNATSTYTYSAETWIKTPFLSVMNGGTQTDAGAPTACSGNKWKCQKVTTTASITATASGANTGYSIETSFMLDITGSMHGQKLTDLKAAANAAIDILVWSDQTVRTSRIAIVPFAQDVRLPTAAAFTAATGMTAADASKQIYGNTFSRNGSEYCVVERKGTEKYTDAAPGAGKYAMASWQWGQPSDAQCDVSSAAALQPLTNDKVVLHNLVNGLQTAGGTAGQIGTAWAWFALSPKWNSLWNNVNHAAAYDTAYNINTKVGNPANIQLKKIAVLMTDGDYNTEYTSDGIDTGTFSESPANDWSQNQAGALCTGMKQNGINVEVYTVGFKVSNAAKTFLTNCATDTSHFYNATDGDSLAAAFRDIAMKIAQIRVSG